MSQIIDGHEQCHRVGLRLILPRWGLFNMHRNLDTCHPRFNVLRVGRRMCNVCLYNMAGVPGRTSNPQHWARQAKVLPTQVHTPAFRFSAAGPMFSTMCSLLERTKGATHTLLFNTSYHTRHKELKSVSHTAKPTRRKALRIGDHSTI